MSFARLSSSAPSAGSLKLRVAVLTLTCAAGCAWHHHEAGPGQPGHVHGPGYAAWYAMTDGPEVVDGGAPTTADAGAPSPDAGAVESSDAGLADAGVALSPDDTPPRSPLVVDARGLPPIRARRIWAATTPGSGTSSPQLADLTGDGVEDVVLCGWFPGQRATAWALDGATGKILWTVYFPEEVYATPALVDLNGDGVPDVVVGGRDAEGVALDGRTGAALWKLRKANPKARLPWRNFNGAVVVPDLDGDGVADLVFSQGGSQDDKVRLAGRVLIVSGVNGHILHDMASPDGREIYSMPAIVPGSSPLEVVIGSGGETLPGHLYRMTPQTKKVSWAVASKQKGFIASPLLYDFTGQGGFDVVTSSFEGTLMRIDGATGEVKWESPRSGQEGYPSPALGAFGGGTTLDAVVGYSRGTYPDFHLTNHLVWVDGQTGAVLDTRVHGVYATSSPLVADLDGDGFDETVSVSMDSFQDWKGQVRSTIGVFDGHRGKAVRLALQVVGAGAATPHLSDLDGDGTLDLIVSYLNHVERYALEVEGGAPPRVRWDGFRGPRHDGVLTRPAAKGP